MSIVKECYPQCDICCETAPDKLASTVKQAQQNARENGWIVKRDEQLFVKNVKG